MIMDPILLAATIVLCLTSIVTVAWFVDLFWMIWMRGSVLAAFCLVACAFGCLAFTCKGSLALALTAGFAGAVLVLRPGVDLAYWLYDMSRLRIGLQQPLEWAPEPGNLLRFRWRCLVAVEEVETEKENRERLAGGLEPVWGYFRERMRLRQEITYRAQLEPDDG
jgi:hypothetical protein